MLEDYLRRHPQRVSGYTFASLAAWSQPYGIMWARVDRDCLLLSRTLPEPEGERHLLQPIGIPSGSCCAGLLAEAARLPYRLRMLYVTPDYMQRNPAFCAHFTAEEDRGGANYIYLARALAELTGGAFARKRNLLAQFLTQHPDWETAPLDTRCGPVCRDVLLAVAHAAGTAPEDPHLQAELQAVAFSIAHLDVLKQRGVMIRVQGRPVAFAIAERQNNDTAVVHFEKALRAHKGLYQMINRETARMLVDEGFHLINREEDLHRPGLRQAKLSYFPLDIYPVFNIHFDAALPDAIAQANAPTSSHE